MRSPQTHTLRALPIVLLVGVMLGSTLVVSRFSLAQWQPLNFVGFRLALASIAFFPLYLARPTIRQARDALFWRRAMLWALFGTVIPMALTVFSLSYQSSGVTALLASINPAVVALQAHFCLQNERLTWRRAIGILLAFSGTVALILSGDSGLAGKPLDWRGPALVLTGVLSAGTSVVYARRFMRHYHALDLAMSRIVPAAPIVIVVALLIEGLQPAPLRSTSGALALVYAALIGTFGALAIGLRLITDFGANYAVQPGYVQPVVATLGGVLFLGERLPAVFGVAIALIGCGLWAINLDTTTKLDGYA